MDFTRWKITPEPFFNIRQWQTLEVKTPFTGQFELNNIIENIFK